VFGNLYLDLDLDLDFKSIDLNCLDFKSIDFRYHFKFKGLKFFEDFVKSKILIF